MGITTGAVPELVRRGRIERAHGPGGTSGAGTAIHAHETHIQRPGSSGGISAMMWDARRGGPRPYSR